MMIDIGRQTVESPEVILSSEAMITLSKGDILKFKEIAKTNQSGKFRFCSHHDSGENVHEMFIVHAKNTYVRPHRHIGKPESMLILEGNASYIYYDNNGNISDVINVGDYGSGREFYISVRNDIFHSLLIRSEQLVFLEITKGPFFRHDTEFAVWSPDSSNYEEALSYMNKLEKSINERIL